MHNSSPTHRGNAPTARHRHPQPGPAGRKEVVRQDLKVHSPTGGMWGMDCEWAWSNMPVWLDSLPLFFFFFKCKHSVLPMVFHNSKTPLLWLSKIPVGLQGTAAPSPQGLSEGQALQCPPNWGSHCQPCRWGKTEFGEGFCRSSPLGCSCLAQL